MIHTSSYDSRRQRRFDTRTAIRMTALLIRLELLDLGKRVAIERTRAGHWQRSAGAWSWWAEDESGHLVVGSQWPATAILAAPKVGIICAPLHDPELFPDDETTNRLTGST